MSPNLVSLRHALAATTALAVLAAPALLSPAHAEPTRAQVGARANAAQSAAQPAAQSSARTAARSSARKAAPQLRMLPQISQFGRKPASPDAAKAVALVTGVRPGVKVQVQQERTSGWKTVATARMPRSGKLALPVPARLGSEPVSYRAVAGGRQSRPSSTGTWLVPGYTDTFSGSKLSSDWSIRDPDYNPAGLRRCSKASMKAVKVGGGVVRLSVIADPAKRGQKCTTLKKGKPAGQYAYRLNGHIGTQGKATLKYGYAAARVKFQRPRGMHGAFWLQPNAASGWQAKTAGAEIDVIEWFGQGSLDSAKNGIASFTYHQKRPGALVKTGGWVRNGASYLQNRKDSWWSNYHVFSLEWTPKSYVMRVDGREYWRSNVGISGTDQFLILSLLSSDYEIPYAGDRVLGSSMSVDWVRTWPMDRP